jgi:hypothetical protein
MTRSTRTYNPRQNRQADVPPVFAFNPATLQLPQQLPFLIFEMEVDLARSRIPPEQFPYPLTANYPLNNAVHPDLTNAVSFAQQLAETRSGVQPDEEERVRNLRDILARMRAFLDGIVDEELLIFRQQTLVLVDAFIQELSSGTRG